MSQLKFLIPIVLLLFLPLEVFGASRISGKASYLYEGVETGRGVAYDSTIERYELLYSKDGRFLDGRLGHYSLQLGQEWLRVGTDIPGESYGMRAHKDLFNVDATIAPGALPFRLHLYAKDMTRSVPRSKRVSLNTFAAGTTDLESVSSYQVYDDIANGTHFEYGGLLIVGIKNGSYLGRYRDALSRFPRLMIDFKVERVKDLKTEVREDYKLTDLAFISLNKKDNWLHYRLKKYENFIDSSRDTGEEVVTIGTIDHDQMRRWINITNWIKLSADFNYRVVTSPARVIPTTQEYDLNVMTDARMSHYGFSLDLYYDRIDDGKIRDEKLLIPLAMHNGWWRSYSSYVAENELSFATGGQLQSDYVQTNLRTEHKVGNYTLVPEVTLEAYRETAGPEVSAARTELSASRQVGRKLNLRAAGAVTAIAGKVPGDGTRDYLEFMEELRLKYRGGGRRTTDLFFRVTTGTGTFTSSGSMGMTPLRGIDGNSRSVSVYSTRLSHTERLAGMGHRLDLTHSYSTFEKASDLSAKYLIDGGRDRSLWSGEAELMRSDTQGEGEKFTQTRSLAGKYKRLHSGQARSGLEAKYRVQDSGASYQSTRTDLKQDFKYSFIRSDGLIRKIGQFEQSLTYMAETPAKTGIRNALALDVDADWYPTQVVRLGCGGTYRSDNDGEQNFIAYRMRAGLYYPLLTAKAEYSHSQRDGDSGTAEDRVSFLLEKRI